VAARSNEFGYANYEIVPAPNQLGARVRGNAPDNQHGAPLAAVVCNMLVELGIGGVTQCAKLPGFFYGF
jgi:hypothetical protein